MASAFRAAFGRAARAAFARPATAAPLSRAGTRRLVLGGLAGAGILAASSAATAGTPPPSCPHHAKAMAAAAAAHSVQDAAYYRRVYSAVAEVLDDLDHDDGSWGPIFVRLAWHAAGTFDKGSCTGGSNGATMRFAPESEHGANAGLAKARARLEAVKARFPEISYADLWSLAGVVAIQEMGGPVIKWRPGRSDAPSAAHCTPDGRLPDATQGADHLRAIFGRMGFSDREIVALSGAHALGRCHTDRSGFEGPWTFAPTTMSNEYFRLLLSETWVPRAWSGPRQFADAKTGSLMMLPSDLALVQDPAMRAWVEKYAADKGAFFADFAAAFAKLGELGVPFAAGSAPMELKPL